VPLNARKTGVVGATGTPILIEDFAPENHWIARPEWAEREGIRSFAGQPLIFRGKILGVLALFSREAIDKEGFSWLRMFADQAAVAITNAQAFEDIAALKARFERENVYLQEEIRQEHDFDEIVGNSPLLLELLRKVDLVAPSDSTVLLLGETGTGKELIARAIHARGSRKGRPLVKVNCGSIPAGLVESELFGHVKGAFTGATSNRIGRFELANKGTLFLDEVGELPLDTQVKLLRALQEQEFEPVGSSRTIRVDVRVIAATNRDLETAVRAGLFRSDLYYRLNVLPLVVPPLRERSSDIPQIVTFFLERFSKKAGKKLVGVSRNTMELLVRYPWPGNIREIQNVIERGVVLSRDSVLDLGPELLPMEASARIASTSRGGPSNHEHTQAQAPASENSPLSLEEVERRHIVSVLERTGRVINGAKGAAAILGMHPSTLRSRMEKLGITRRG
jgi:formate hydrogenlyase transcriptional activator